MNTERLMSNSKIVFEMESINSDRSKAANIKPEDEQLFEHEFFKKIGSTQAIWCNRSYIFDSLLITNHTSLNRLQTIIRYYNKTKHHVGLKERFKLLNSTVLSTMLPPLKIRSGIWITDRWTQDYFHWVTEGLAKILFLSNIGLQTCVMLPASYNNYNYIKESLEYFNIKYQILPSYQLTQAEEVYTVKFNYDPGNFDYRILALFRSKIKIKNSNNHTPKRIWVSRSNASKRRIINEIALYPALSKYNFDIVYPEHLTFDNQVSLFQSADIIAGLHGAGLTNMLFMNTHSKVLEIRKKEDNLNNCYFTLASDLKHDYYYLLADPVGSNSHEGDCYVNEQLLESVFSQMIS
jgi:hypothetical protein